jgi:hypothetical protein
VIIHPFRPFSEYLAGHRDDLRHLLRASGVYLIARPAHPDRVLIGDVMYVGLAGAAAHGQGSFEQRIRSHAGKLVRGAEEPGCPRAWAQYYSEYGGPDALDRHVLRLVHMPSDSPQHRLAIARMEDTLLIAWELLRDGRRFELPSLNARDPDIRGLGQLFSGTVERASPLVGGEAPAHMQAPAQHDELLLGGLGLGDDLRLEFLQPYAEFFAARGLTALWQQWVDLSLARGLELRIARIAARDDRPGELRLTTSVRGALRASAVHAIFLPKLEEHFTSAQLRLSVDQLPATLAQNARPFQRGAMRSCIDRLPYGRVQEVIELFSQ